MLLIENNANVAEKNYYDGCACQKGWLYGGCGSVHACCAQVDAAV